MRWPLIVVALATVIGLAVAERGDDELGPGAARTVQGMVSEAPGPDARAGVWYCSEGTSMPGEFADHSIIVANPTGIDVVAEVSVFPSTPVGSVSPSAGPERVLLNVPARSQAALRLAEVVGSQYTAALVEVDSGAAVVEQRVQGPTGIDVVPCATRSSAVWHFAAGSTRRDARLIFTLFNPFPDRAVVKFTFSTDEGVREPHALRGVLVPARSLLVVNATELVPRFSSVATTVESQAGADRGREAPAVRRHRGTGGADRGAGDPGAPDPMGVSHRACRGERSRAHRAVQPLRSRSSRRHQHSDGRVRPRGTPWRRSRVSVPPWQRVVLAFGNQSAYPRPDAPLSYGVAESLPEGVGFWAAVQVYNGVPIVAERVAAASAASSPAGVATTAGTPATAMRYLVAGNRADDAEVALAVVNPSADSIVRITVSKIADGRTSPIDQLDSREIAPHGRLVLPVDQLTDGDSYALLVEASQPVVVSRSLLARSGTGMASGISVPFGPHTARPRCVLAGSPSLSTIPICGRPCRNPPHRSRPGVEPG